MSSSFAILLTDDEAKPKTAAHQNVIKIAAYRGNSLSYLPYSPWQTKTMMDYSSSLLSAIAMLANHACFISSWKAIVCANFYGACATLQLRVCRMSLCGVYACVLSLSALSAVWKSPLFLVLLLCDNVILCV
jgi:hypothetical protein